MARRREPPRHLTLVTSSDDGPAQEDEDADVTPAEVIQPGDAAEPGLPAVIRDPLPLPSAPPADDRQRLRVMEALLFAAKEPVEEGLLAQHLGDGADLRGLLRRLQADYHPRGINLVRIDRRWAFRTAPDLAQYLRIEEEQRKRLSRAATETLAIIAYHQPVTRAEIESIRAVATSKGTLDLLMEAGWIRPGRRRETPGRPLTWLTSEHFLDHFGLASLRDLPGVEELRAAGLLDPRPVLATVPQPEDDTADDPDPAEDTDG